MQPPYNTPGYSADLDMKLWKCHAAAPKFLYHVILDRNYRKITIKWSFSYNSSVKLSLKTQFTYNMVHSYGPQI